MVCCNNNHYPRCREHFLTPQHTATLISSVDWGIGWMCIWGAAGIDLDGSRQSFGPRLQDGTATVSHLDFGAGKSSEGAVDLLPHHRPAYKALIPSRFLSRPAPDLLIGVEVRAVARQVHQPKVQVGASRYDRIAGPRCAGALSQITLSRPPCFRRNRSKRATELSPLLSLATFIHSTSPWTMTSSNSSTAKEEDTQDS